MLLQDVRYALRTLWNSKGFAAVAIVCLGVGIGLNTTIFSVVDGVLLKPPPYADPERLVVLESVNGQIGVTQGGISYEDLRDLKASRGNFVAMAASQGRSLTIADGGEPARYSGAAISWDLFPVLGVSPILGQGFREEDDRPGVGGAVIISYAVWTQRYQADPHIIGRSILVNAVPSVVVGVMPEGFAFPNNQRLWVPLAPIVHAAPRDARSNLVVARLAPGATLESAQSEVATVTARLAAIHPDTNERWSARVRTLRSRLIPPDVSLVIWLMMAGVTLVLFIACSNVANLLLARASVRRREIAVRTALGAGRRRIVRQLLTESVVLALASVPLGVLLAEAGSRLIFNAMPPDQVPYYIHWEVDLRSLLYTVAIAVGTALLFGLLPALQVSRGNLHESLKEGTRGNSARRSLLRSSLVVVQVALALVALVSALLFVRSFTNLDAYNVGFDPKPLMTMRFYLPGEAYEAPDAMARRVQDIVERIERLPTVEAAFASNLVPVSGGGGAGNAVIDGRPAEKGSESFMLFTGVTPHFFRTLGVLVTRGREFTASEGWSRQPVAVINQTMATKFWPDQDPIGRRFRLAQFDEAGDWFTVIGVAPDVKHDDVDAADRPQPSAYVPYIYQQTLNTGLVIRVAGDPALIAAAAREEIRAADPNLPVFAVNTMDDVRRLGFWQYGLFGWVFGTIGVVGLLLAAVGVYGVLSYSVAQRTQEIGVRVALGAARHEVVRLVVNHGLMLTLVGVIGGLILAPIGTWAGRSLFYDVSPFDPLSFGAVAAFLLVVAVFASYLPARRATRVNPMDALRGE